MESTAQKLGSNLVSYRPPLQIILFYQMSAVSTLFLFYQLKLTDGTETAVCTLFDRTLFNGMFWRPFSWALNKIGVEVLYNYISFRESNNFMFQIIL